MKNVWQRNLPQETWYPRTNTANGRVCDGISGFPIPPQYQTRGPVGTDEKGWVIFGPLDNRNPHHTDRLVPDLFGIGLTIFTGSNNDYDEDE